MAGSLSEPKPGLGLPRSPKVHVKPLWAATGGTREQAITNSTCHPPIPRENRDVGLQAPLIPFLLDAPSVSLLACSRVHSRLAFTEDAIIIALVFPYPLFSLFAPCAPQPSASICLSAERRRRVAQPMTCARQVVEPLQAHTCASAIDFHGCFCESVFSSSLQVLWQAIRLLSDQTPLRISVSSFDGSAGFCWIRHCWACRCRSLASQPSPSDRPSACTGRGQSQLSSRPQVRQPNTQTS